MRALAAVLAGLILSAGSLAAFAADPGSDAGAPIGRTPPDPPAMSESKQWVYDLRWDSGEVFLVGVHPADMGGPHLTPRVMGRFALELFEGPTLIERARFDFPMLGDGADGALTTKLKTRIGVMFPATKRGTRLELWDRATGRRWPLPWPPVPSAPAPDAGTEAGAK